MVQAFSVLLPLVDLLLKDGCDGVIDMKASSKFRLLPSSGMSAVIMNSDILLIISNPWHRTARGTLGHHPGFPIIFPRYCPVKTALEG